MLKKTKKRLKKYKSIIFVLCLIWWFFISSFTEKQIFAADLLEKAFEKSKQFDQVINLWNNKNAVWNEVFQKWTNINISTNWISTTTTDPLLVRITKFLLRLTVLLSVTMILYNAVNYIAAAWDEWDSWKAKKAIYNVIIWILIAMFSISLVYLISSITTWTLPWILRQS